MRLEIVLGKSSILNARYKLFIYGKVFYMREAYYVYLLCRNKVEWGECVSKCQ